MRRRLPRFPRKSERLEKGLELLLLGLGQIPESPGHVFRLAFMAFNGVPQRQDLRSCMNRGRMRRSQRAGFATFRRVLRTACTMPSPVPIFMQQEIAVGVDDLFPNAAGTTNVPPLMRFPAGRW